MRIHHGTKHLALLAAVAMAGPARAQTRVQNTGNMGTSGVAAPQAPSPFVKGENTATQKPAEKAPAETAVTGKVVQMALPCLTCALPEIRFCLSPDAKPLACAGWFVYLSASKEDIGAAYQALLAAVTADKWITVMWGTGPVLNPASLSAGQQSVLSRAMAEGAHGIGKVPAQAHPVARFVLQVER